MKKINIVSLVLIFIIIILGSYFIISSRIDAKYEPNYTLEDYYKKPIKKVGVNSYTVSQVSSEDMIKTYFSTYTSMLYEDIESAYSHLDKKEKIKYPNLSFFKNKVSNLTKDFTELPKLKTYDIGKEDDKTIYKMSDEHGNVYIFKIEAVMKYTVSFQ